MKKEFCKDGVCGDCGTVPADAPIRLTSARAWRTYLGGKLIDQLHGITSGGDTVVGSADAITGGDAVASGTDAIASSTDAITSGGDGHFPEEWIASVVSARNAGREEIEEGKSMLAENPDISLAQVIESAPERYLGQEHVRNHGAAMGVLVKLIDAAERLTVQSHPDREQAQRLFHSPFGKTECWHILGGRQVNGEEPCVYLGFREGITRQRWEALFREQDFDGMLSCMHRFDVEPGDTIFIEGGVPHAIGAGCFLTEIQEPTDYTIRIERTTPSGFAVDDFMCHQGLGFDRMFDCFHYEGLSAAETRRRWFIPPRIRLESEGGKVTTLIGPDNTDFFSMEMLEIYGELELELPQSFAGLYVLEGQGAICAKGWEMVRAGDQFFLPAGMQRLQLRSGNGYGKSCGDGCGKSCLRAILFSGPRS